MEEDRYQQRLGEVERAWSAEVTRREQRWEQEKPKLEGRVDALPAKTAKAEQRKPSPGRPKDEAAESAATKTTTTRATPPGAVGVTSSAPAPTTPPG
ncbi:MAG TPA: hypothetical protein VM677_26690, partial [Actinokineospora sp.]|nr:hypothetical protein [Actinokineospora sp.]